MMDRLLVTIAILMRTLVSQSTTCYEEWECSQATISTTYAYCSGYFGCYLADITATYANCYGYCACQYADITASSWVYAQSRYSAYGATITAPNMYIDGYRSFYQGELTATGTVYAMGEQGAYGAEITATTVYGRAYYSLMYANIWAQTVYGYAERTLIYANIEPKDTTLTVYFGAYESGYGTDITCNDGQTCEVYCETPEACYNVNFYCYSGATCHYVNDCDDSGSDYCVNLYGSESGGLTDVEIRKIYEENKKRRTPDDESPIDGPDGDEPDQPDEPLNIVPNADGNYYLSLTNAQFAILCLLVTVLLGGSIGLCFYHTSGIAKRYFQKEDFN